MEDAFTVWYAIFATNPLPNLIVLIFCKLPGIQEEGSTLVIQVLSGNDTATPRHRAFLPLLQRRGAGRQEAGASDQKGKRAQLKYGWF